MRGISRGTHDMGIGKRTAGFSLVELMIAMVLGILVMGAAFAIFMSNQNTYRANEGLNRIQESARTAVELISRDIRAAGGSACSNLATMETSDGNSVSLDRNPVSGDANEITIVSGSELAYPTDASTANSVTIAASELDQASDVFNVGDVLVLCDAQKTFVVTATGVSGRTVTFSPSATFHYPVSVMLGRFRSTRWFVEPNGRGTGNSLFVSRAAGAREEVAEGVESIAFSYLQPGGVFTPAPADWNQVAAVRMVLTLQAQNSIDGRALSRTATSVVNLRARSL